MLSNKPGFYIDFEFMSKDGPPISLGIVHEDSNSGRYFIFNDVAQKMIEKNTPADQWVLDNIYPVLRVPFTTRHPTIPTVIGSTAEIVQELVAFIKQTGSETCYPKFMADWPVDFAYLSNLLITGPGTMVDLLGYTTELYRVDPYPNSHNSLVQHNALCDAVALKYKMKAMVDEFKSIQ